MSSKSFSQIDSDARKRKKSTKRKRKYITGDPILNDKNDHRKQTEHPEESPSTEKNLASNGPVEGNPKPKRKVSHTLTAAPARRLILTNKPQTRKYAPNHITSGKYSPYSFLPKFLYEQFRRYSNVFFLCISALQQIPNVSPTGRFTTLVPFICILTVSACKEIVEDFKRHKSDRETNQKHVMTFKNASGLTDVTWNQVQVGDFLKIKDDQEFPCDLVLYSSCEKSGICYVETANLDGETNLKIRQALQVTAHVTDEIVPSIEGYIECEEPNRFLYEFLGKICVDGKTENALGPDQVLLRGSKLKNTNWIIGQVIYTGHETKLMKNANKAPLKQSTVDKITNRQIFLLFLLLMAIAITTSTLSMWWTAHVARSPTLMWYLPPPDPHDNSYTFLLTMFTFVILFNSLIPISLTVTLEMVRFVQATFISKDLDMYYEESDIPAVAKTSNLNEELGIIRYIFSDKTGTLTQNVMEFKGCSVSGIFYPPHKIKEGDKSPLIHKIISKHETAEDIRDFLTILAVCHTVIPDRSTGELVYHASSPDERALVLGAKKYGFEFDSRTPSTISIYIQIGGVRTQEVYQILNILEFTSDRKRMSVVVRRPSGRLTLFCKGADMMIFDRLSSDHGINAPHLTKKTQKHLDHFSRLGLRTLCLALKELPENEYKKWDDQFRKAQTNLDDRDRLLAELGEQIEINLRLIGATAIEDKLQEQVPETIQSLLRGGISIWVLTGDKQETAINIGRSCNLITPNMQLFLINQPSKTATLGTINNYLEQLHSQYGEQIPEDIDAAVVIDGKTLNFAITKGVRPVFVYLCTSCRVVVCCRASPFQKAEIVRAVTSKTGKVTLAIGDGANDVAMIQKAHVGVGIAGVEGLQAASSSDYAIGQFQYLKKLLFVHGAWNYNRISKVILFCFYKNILLHMVELWFAGISGFSGQVIYDRWTISLYNLVFTATQPLAIGLFEKNCRAEMRMQHPKLYIENQSCFSMEIFMLWTVISLAQSILAFVMCSYIVGHGMVWSHGRDGGYHVLGNFVYTSVIVICSLKAGIELKGWTLFSHMSIWGSIVLWFIALPLYGLLGTIVPAFGMDMIGVAGMVFTSISFWLMLPIVVVLAFIPELCFQVLRVACVPEREEDRRRTEDVLLQEQDSGEKIIYETESVIAELQAKKTSSTPTLKINAEEHSLSHSLSVAYST